MTGFRTQPRTPGCGTPGPLAEPLELVEVHSRWTGVG
jgi:hypothetical protein